jgi:hypothetical protein
MTYFKSLEKKFREKVDFRIIVMTVDSTITLSNIQEKYNLNTPIYFDNLIAERCGVYSTPQAVIIDQGGKLYYRGNYNKSRYCTEKESDFAEMALDSLFNSIHHPSFSPVALTAYGCQLPTCNK